MRKRVFHSISKLLLVEDRVATNDEIGQKTSDFSNIGQQTRRWTSHIEHQTRRRTSKIGKDEGHQTSGIRQAVAHKKIGHETSRGTSDITNRTRRPASNIRQQTRRRTSDIRHQITVEHRTRRSTQQKISIIGHRTSDKKLLIGH